ncbi:hypothetical protein PPYR_00704 [Photinus pyralis]|uniref:PiggyBac transposable element-derived protein domain-containing protein n=1 Tax=Photinus pyralis TaxID=7054 RepID=A0A5N4B2D9_PHOPY|nr:hypothetical protein PPYR_00704 [Photinus pyralis]
MSKSLPTLSESFTLQEALEMISNEDNVEEIYVEPPEANVLTDEDSGDEDGGGMVDNLSGPQLRAPAEVRFINTTPRVIVPSKLRKLKWINGDIQSVGRAFDYPNSTEFKELSCVQLFEKFIDDDIIKLLVKETQNYALFNNCANPNISAEEIKCFIGILILTGYNHLPGKRYYWDMGSDMRNNLVYNSMRRDRFLQICRFIHCADNNLPDMSDKMWKLRPLMDKIKAKCLSNFQPEENLNYDECMIKYYGRHGCKQFIRGKPIRFGYKMWCFNTASGYLINFDIYQGNNPRRRDAG